MSDYWLGLGIGLAIGAMVMSGWTIAMVTWNLRKREQWQQEDEEP